MTIADMSPELRELRARMKEFIDDVVMKAEPELERLAEQGYHPETGIPLELYDLAAERGDDTSAGVRGLGLDAAIIGRRNTGLMADLKAEAKARGLWALGHPAEIGGGGLPFMDFVFLNEIIGRSEYGQVAVGSASMQDSIMLHLYGTAAQNSRSRRPSPSSRRRPAWTARSAGPPLSARAAGCSRRPWSPPRRPRSTRRATHSSPVRGIQRARPTGRREA